MENIITTKTPCCGRVMHLPLYKVATCVTRRTCRKCGQRYQVIVRPLASKRVGVFIHAVEWTPLR